MKLELNRQGIYYTHKYPERGFYRNGTVYFVVWLTVTYSNKETATLHHRNYSILGATDYYNISYYLQGADEIEVYGDLDLTNGDIHVNEMKTLDLNF